MLEIFRLINIFKDYDIFYKCKGLLLLLLMIGFDVIICYLELYYGGVILDE